MAILGCLRLTVVLLAEGNRCAAALWAVHAVVQSESRNASGLSRARVRGNTYAPQLRSNAYKCLPLSDTSFISTSFVPLLLCIMSTANIKYPPVAHTYHDKSAAKPAVTSSQPRASATMAVGPNNDQARVGKAERIRGGCVPCPVCVKSFVCA